MSAARRLLAAACVAGCVVAARLVLYPHLALVAPEECLTGAIASTLVGARPLLSLSSYTPALDEPGQLAVGAAAAPFVAWLGPSALALKLTASTFSWLRAIAALSLLDTLLRARLGAVAPSPARALLVGAAALFAAQELVLPSLDTMMATQAQGTHTAGAAADLALLALAARRLDEGRGPSTRWWALAGACTAFKPGALLPVAAVHAGARHLPRGGSSSRAALAFALGFAPRLAWSVAQRARDLDALLARLDALRGPSRLGDLLGELWALVVERNPARLAWLALGCVAAARAISSRRARPAAGALGAYAALVAGAMVCDPQGAFWGPYLLPALSVLTAVEAASLARGLASRPWRVALATVVASGVCVVSARPRWGLDVGTVAALRRAPGACSWQLGASLARDAPSRWLTRCRTLGDDALACVTGAGFARVGAPRDASDAERRAWSFGVGRATVHAGDDAVPDGAAPGEVASGAAWECDAYADMICRVARGPAPRPRPSRRCPEFTAMWGGRCAERPR